MIESTLGWTVHSRSWLRKIQDQLSDRQKGVRDELGVQSIHSAFADRFFPGTSVQQTRLRYVLFVPWIYRELGGQNLGSDFASRLAHAEVQLVQQLRQEESRDVIGARVAPRPAVQPPSVIYWTAIRTWGLLRRFGNGFPSRRAVHRILAYDDRASDLRDDEGEPLQHGFEPFFSDIPDPPSDLLNPSKPLGFTLTRGEREFLIDRLGAVTRGPGGDLTLLANLVKEASAFTDCSWPWDPRIPRVADESDARAIEVARRASHLVGVVRAAYAALVETIRDEDDGFDSSHEHRDHLETVLARSAETASTLDLDELDGYVVGSAMFGPLYEVLDQTQAWLGLGGDVRTLRDSYARCETARKGSRACLPRTAAARERRVEWTSPPQDGLDYRWSTVRVFLRDLATRE